MAEAMAHDLSSACMAVRRRSLALLEKISPELCRCVSGFLQNGDREKHQKPEPEAPVQSQNMRHRKNPVQPRQPRPVGNPGCGKRAMTRERCIREHLF